MEDDAPLAVPLFDAGDVRLEPVGITMITGYLGAGKTTVRNTTLNPAKPAVCKCHFYLLSPKPSSSNSL